MRRVIIESPYAGNVDLNMDYARAAMRDCLLRGEAPFASHLLYTQPGVFDDENADERQAGIHAGLAWATVANAVVVYIDLGISGGMKYGIATHEMVGRTIDFRSLDDWRERHRHHAGLKTRAKS